MTEPEIEKPVEVGDLYEWTALIPGDRNDSWPSLYDVDRQVKVAQRAFDRRAVTLPAHRLKLGPMAITIQRRDTVPDLPATASPDLTWFFCAVCPVVAS